MPARVQALEAGELAWVAALPCALAMIAAIVLLGPPLGHAFLRPGAEAFWPRAHVVPEPVEHARYLLALLGAPLLATVVVRGTRRVRMRPPATRLLAAGSQACLLAFLVTCLLAQHDVLFTTDVHPPGPFPLFPWPVLLLAAAVVGLLVAMLRRREAIERVVRGVGETRSRALVCGLLAVLVTATWLLTTINSDATIAHAAGNNLIPWDMSEAFAVLDGRTPLVDFHAQYANLWPCVAAAVMALLGSTGLGAWTTIMASISGLALLALYGVLRRVVRSATLALALFVPLVATGFYVFAGTKTNRFGPAGIFSLWPLRYAGPYMLAWLTARHLDRVAPRRTWLLLLAGGLVVLNNLEFGAGALVATLVALACARPPSSRRTLAHLVLSALAGLLGALVLVSALTLVRAGALPHLGLLLEFPRIYGIGGWVLEAMPLMGLHLALYATFTAAIVIATVRAARGDDEPVLTGMLAWSGTFGLIAGGYYAGRSDGLSLVSLFSPWCLTLVLLLILAVRSLAAHPRRWTRLPELAVVFGFGLMLGSLAQVPAPWTQIARLGDAALAPLYKQSAALRFIGALTRPGEKVVILIPLGHRIAYDLGLENIAPYSGTEAMPLVEQLQTTVDLMRRQHVRKLFLDARATRQEQGDALQQVGFSIRAQRGTIWELVDSP